MKRFMAFVMALTLKLAFLGAVYFIFVKLLDTPLEAVLLIMLAVDVIDKAWKMAKEIV